MVKFTLLRRLCESFNSIDRFIINKNGSVLLDLEIREQSFYAPQNCYEGEAFDDSGFLGFKMKERHKCVPSGLQSFRLVSNSRV